VRQKHLKGIYISANLWWKFSREKSVNLCFVLKDMDHHTTPDHNQSKRLVRELPDGPINCVYHSNVRGLLLKTFHIQRFGKPLIITFPPRRVASMPNTGVEEEYYRLRHFSITGKGIVNRGDSLKSRRSRSNNSVASSNSR
jgi:hypothetical protein